MRVSRLFLTFLACLMFAAPVFAAQTLVPHRAVYDLTLEDATDRSGITGIEGRMVYEFGGSACSGYTVTFRFVTRIDTNEVSRITDQRTTTYEDGDGETFDFVTRTYVDQNLDREINGMATNDGKGTSVTLKKPEKAEYALGPAQFPTSHILELLRKAREGERFYETRIFDGSDGADKVMTTTIVLGDADVPPAGDLEREALGDLASQPVWPVDIAYFDLETEAGEELPSYRISFKLHDNGITRDLVMDYGDFAMSGRLVDLAVFEPEADCAR